MIISVCYNSGKKIFLKIAFTDKNCQLNENDLFKGQLNMVNETGIVGIQEKIICKTNTEFMEETGLIGIFMLKSLLTDIGQTIN